MLRFTFECKVELYFSLPSPLLFLWLCPVHLRFSLFGPYRMDCQTALGHVTVRELCRTRADCTVLTGNAGTWLCLMTQLLEVPAV